MHVENTLKGTYKQKMFDTPWHCVEEGDIYIIENNFLDNLLLLKVCSTDGKFFFKAKLVLVHNQIGQEFFSFSEFLP